MITKTIVAAACAVLITSCSDDSPSTSMASTVTSPDIVVRASGETYDDYISRLYEAASVEGRVVYYQHALESELAHIRDQWDATFPEVELEAVTAGADFLLERALAEADGADPVGDVFAAAGVEMLVLDEAQALDPYRPAGLDAVGEDFILDGPYVGLNYMSRHPLYNPATVAVEELPADWFGYCEPRWKGRIGFGDESYDWAAAFVEAWGVDRAREFFACIAANDPILHDAKDGPQLVSDGVLDVKLDTAGHVSAQFIETGAAVAVQVPSPTPIPAIVDLAGILVNAPHPNAARLLQEFWLMDQGRLAMSNEGKATTTSRIEDHPYGEFMDEARLVVLGPDASESLTIGFELFDEYFG